MRLEIAAQEHVVLWHPTFLMQTVKWVNLIMTWNPTKILFNAKINMIFPIDNEVMLENIPRDSYSCKIMALVVSK